MAKGKKTKSLIEEEMDAIRTEIEQGRKEIETAKPTASDLEKIVESVEQVAPEKETEVVTLSQETAPIIETKVCKELQVKEVVDESLEVYNLIRAGYSKVEIRTMCARWKEKKFNAVYKRACDMIAQSVKDLETAKAEAICRYNDLYQKSYKNGNIKGCKEIQDSLCKVQGITKDLAIQAEFVTAFK
ncbi:MAG: hypothetical protein II304_03440 [Bacteroidales bacterium]|nr:hypothetical protein [Bacteroidales bacterium]